MSQTSPRGAIRHGLGVNDRPLRELADASAFTIFQRLHSSPKGLTELDAAERLHRHGDNKAAPLVEPGVRGSAGAALRSPFVALLTALGVVFVALGDSRGAVTVSVMVVLSVGLRWWQHTRSDRAVLTLQERVSTTVTVRRRADVDSSAADREVPVQDLVPGDVVLLGAGDEVPADVRVLTATNLRVDQSALSGETLPVTKQVASAGGKRRDAEKCRRTAGRGNAAGRGETGGRGDADGLSGLVESPVLCFGGTSIVAGSVTAVVVATGADTYFGTVREAVGPRPESSFDSGVRGVGWTLIRFMLVLVPIVLTVNGAVTGDWVQAAMFAMAVAVGLTPEMLPVIVTTNLARGATRLSRRQVIVKRLNALQDLGATEVLCVDKTGTLTEDRVAYAHSVDLSGRPDDEAAEYAYVAATFQDAADNNQLDDAILDQLAESDDPLTGARSTGALSTDALLTGALFTKVDEIGFDHVRRRSSVVVQRSDDEHLLITKGDPAEVVPLCTHARRDGAVVELSRGARVRADEVARTYAEHGMRVLAVAGRQSPARLGSYGEADEAELVLVGFVGFVDPVREDAADSVRALARHGVGVKILTGDNQQVAARVAEQVGIRVGEVAIGREIDALDDTALREVAARTTVFARLTPEHKARIVAALRQRDHAVGFVGDGVNDAPALRTADVGSVPDTATDVAKSAADLILLKKDLAVLSRGVVEGRRTLGNTMKYVKITASSNFGNVCTVVTASAFLPFLPMLPVQLMVQNLLYDTAQLALPWDRVGTDYLRRPRRWNSRGLVRFMLVFGALSSLFDLSTFAVLWWVFDVGAHPAVFQTGWFLVGLLSQILVVLVLRTRTLPWGEERPSAAVAVAALVMSGAGLLLPFSPLAEPLQLHAPPATYLLWLMIGLLGYGAAAQLTKTLYLRRQPSWL